MSREECRHDGHLQPVMLWQIPIIELSSGEGSEKYSPTIPLLSRTAIEPLEPATGGGNGADQGPGVSISTPKLKKSPMASELSEESNDGKSNGI